MRQLLSPVVHVLLIDGQLLDVGQVDKWTGLWNRNTRGRAHARLFYNVSLTVVQLCNYVLNIPTHVLAMCISDICISSRALYEV